MNQDKVPADSDTYYVNYMNPPGEFLFDFWNLQIIIYYSLFLDNDDVFEFHSSYDGGQEEEEETTRTNQTTTYKRKVVEVVQVDSPTKKKRPFTFRSPRAFARKIFSPNIKEKRKNANKRNRRLF